MAHSVYVPSTDAVLASLRMATQTEEEIVNEYLSYPKLPYGKAIKIDKIALLNFDPMAGECQGKIRYLTFRQRCPEEFPKGENPMEDYMDEEQVAPVIFVCGDTKYRVKMVSAGRRGQSYSEKARANWKKVLARGGFH